MRSQYYEEARVGLAIAPTPSGPFTYLGSFSPHGQAARDMNVFAVRAWGGWVRWVGGWVGARHERHCGGWVGG